MVKRTIRAWIGVLLCSAAAGCTSIHECVNDAEMDVRNHVLAQKAWGEWSWCYDDLDHPSHFARGFKDGYTDILEGGTGCQPTLPPKCYWKPHYQSPQGRCSINAWFDGFSHGALAAQQDGYGNLQQIPISPTARANLMTRRAPPVAFPCLPPGAQPLPVPDRLIEVPGRVPDEPHDGSVPLPGVSEEAQPLQPSIRPYED